MTRRLHTYGRSTLGVWPSPVVAAIRDRLTFTTSGNLRGETCAVFAWTSTGRLSDKSLATWHHERPHIDYVVWSYATPIAWHVSRTRGDWWTLPDDSYSVTTTRHQGLAGLAVSLDGGGHS